MTAAPLAKKNGYAKLAVKLSKSQTMRFSRQSPNASTIEKDITDYGEDDYRAEQAEAMENFYNH